MYSDEHSGKVKSFMLDVLCPLITESDNVSSQLLDIILINIVEPQKSSKKNAYHLAKELIIKTNETMEQYIQQVRKPQMYKFYTIVLTQRFHNLLIWFLFLFVLFFKFAVL